MCGYLGGSQRHIVDGSSRPDRRCEDRFGADHDSGLRHAPVLAASYCWTTLAGIAAALADRDALVFRPRPDVAAAFPARCGTRRPAALSASGLAGMFDVGRDLPAERAGVLLTEIDFVFGAAEPEPQRLDCWASIKVVFEFDSDPLCHRGLHDCDGLSAP